jgi:hypothetical protein
MKQYDVIAELFKDFAIKDFNEMFNDNSVSIELDNDRMNEASERGDSQLRTSSFVCYLRKKNKKNQKYYSELSKIIDTIFKQYFNLIDKGEMLVIEYTPAFVQDKDEIHILFNIEYNYYI